MKYIRHALVVAALTLTSVPMSAHAQTPETPDILTGINSAAGLPSSIQEQLMLNTQEILNARATGDPSKVANAEQIYSDYFAATLGNAETDLFNAEAQLTQNPSSGSKHGQVTSAQTIVDGLNAANTAIQAFLTNRA